MLRFYSILILEILAYPILYIFEELKKRGIVPINSGPLPAINRKKANSDKLLVCIHDWAGYDAERKKTFKNGKVIDCGLKYQLDRFKNYKGNKEIKCTITISDTEKYQSNDYSGINIIPVSNTGFDFSGYANFANQLPEENCYVIMMNTSVEKTQVDFIDDYITFMESNPEIGLLGISYSTQMFQTFIKNNFIPHIQSFFLLTTSDILKLIIKYNGEFPGKNISYKRLLIREGEIKFSKIIEKLGYALCIIDEEGKPFIFPTYKKHFFNSYKCWKMPFGDYRYALKTPNKINKIHQ